MANYFGPRNIFEEKAVLTNVDLIDLINGEIIEPTFPEGESLLTITRCKSEEMYGKYSGDIKAEITLEGNCGNRLTQIFLLKKGKNNNLAKFIYQVLGFEPKEFNLKDLEGKKIIATVFHFYNEAGLGHANIAFCKPELVQEAEIMNLGGEE